MSTDVIAKLKEMAADPDRVWIHGVATYAELLAEAGRHRVEEGIGREVVASCGAGGYPADGPGRDDGRERAVRQPVAVGRSVEHDGPCFTNCPSAN